MVDPYHDIAGGLPMLLLILAGCGPHDDVDTGLGRQTPFTLRGDDFVGLPYTVAGAPMGSASLRVSNVGDVASDGGITVEVPDPFDVTGDTGSLAPGEERILTVSYGGSTASAGLFTADMAILVEGQRLAVEVSAVVGDVALPDVTWTSDELGQRATVGLPSAPFPYGDAPYDDPSVLIFVPESLTDDDGVGVVTHLHGHNATLAEVVATQHLVEQHALSGRDAVLVVPQGPEEAADSDFGRLDEAGGLADLTRDVLTLLYRDGLVERPRLGLSVVTAHSGGYSAAANIVDRGGVEVAAVHLFDALYGRGDTFATFAEEGHVLRSGYTASGGTDGENADLATALAGAGVDVSTSFADDDLDADAVTIGPLAATHDACVSAERGYARWLAASGLGVRPAAPPTLRSVLSDGASTTVAWREDPGGQPLVYRVEGSDDGEDWTLLASTTERTAVVTPSPWIRVVRTDVSWGDSDPSDAYAGSGADWLIVDGFDRVLDGSWEEASHPFAARVAAATGDDVSTVANEAVEAGEVDLDAYPGVLWLLGDEGTADVTFSAAERAAVEDYLAAGGRLVVSGAEVGYATDRSWMEDVLHASFVADDAGTDVVEGMTLGEAYPEDYPDVLDGDDVLWRYETGDAAAVGWAGQIIVIGFGLENLPEDDARTALAGLLGRLQ